jgi:hypothetical protein
MILVLGCSLSGASGVAAAVGERSAKSETQLQPTGFRHQFPTTMTIEEAMQYELRLEDRDEFSAEVEPDQNFTPHAAKAVPGAIKNYPIPPGSMYCGETTWDFQWYGSSQRSIEHGVDNSSYPTGKRFIHVTWTMLESYDLNDANRNVHYNCYDWSVPGWTVCQHSWGGMPIIEDDERGGYSHLEVNSAGNAIVFHHSYVEGTTAYTSIARFSIPGYGIYTADQLPSGQENIWPTGAIGDNGAGADVYHVGVQDSDPAVGDPAWQGYWRYITPDGPWQGPVPMGRSMVRGQVLAADGDRVIYAWPQARDYGVNRNYYNNDLAYWESTNAGADWIVEGGRDETDWAAGAGYNVTDYVDADPQRVFIDMSLMFDFDGRLHAIFTTPGYDDATGKVSVGPTVMQHWNEGTPGSNEQAVVSGGAPGGFVGGQDAYHSIAASAQWGAVDPDFANDGSAGQWNRYISKMTLGIGDGSTSCSDPSNGNTNYGYLYACYTLFGGMNVADRMDASEAGFQNGNIAISMSNDNGFSWAAPAILTTVEGALGGTPTRSPNCNCETDTPNDPECANPCRSEHWGSMARLVNDTMHVFYVCDYDAGAAPLDEGNWSVNKLVYHPVIGDGVLDGNLCPTIAPVLWASLTADPNCEYHGELAPGRDPYQVETLEIANFGNADLVYTGAINYISGSSWMDFDGGQSISSTTIAKGEPSETYTVTMDAESTPGKGLWLAEIQINHNDPLQFADPFVISVEFFVADSFVCGAGAVMTTPCVALEVSNVASWGRENHKGGMWYYGAPDDDSLYSPLYDASLLIADKTATAAGPDTIVYRDIFSNSTPSNPGFRALETLKLSYDPATDESVAVANQVTVDSTIGISVKYIFPQAEDSCEFVRVVYRVYPRSDNAVDLIVGAALDADCHIASDFYGYHGDVGGFVADYNLVYLQGTIQDTLSQYPDTIDATTKYAAGMTALTCALAKRMVVQSNRNYVFPDGGFGDQYIYTELDSNGVTIWYDLGEDDDDSDDFVDDLHAIVAFDEATVSPDHEQDNHVYQLALVSSTQAQEGVDAFDYHGGSYDGYIADLLATTKKAWEKGFGWYDNYAFNRTAVDDTDSLYFQATGTHKYGMAGGCCGCQFSLVGINPPEASISIVDAGECRGFLLFDETPEGQYEITLQVGDLCGAQLDEITIDVTVEHYCYCGLPGDINNDGNCANPLDLADLLLYIYCSCGYFGYNYDLLGNCPYPNGDLNGDYSASPQDVILLAMKIYKNDDRLCQDRCSGCP